MLYEFLTSLKGQSAHFCVVERFRQAGILVRAVALYLAGLAVAAF